MINLNQLKYFYDVCINESFTESAKINKISHSAISQAIRNLEQFYEVELVIHKKNYFELTEEGRVIFSNINSIFDSVINSKNQIELKKNDFTGQLKLGFSHSVAMGIMLGHLKDFHKKYPRIIPLIKLANSKELADLLLSRELDLGIGIDDGNFFKLESDLLRKGKFVLAASKKEANFKEESFLVGDKGEEVIKFKHWYKKNELTNPIIEIPSWEIINKMAQNGLGIGLMPDYLLTGTHKLYILNHDIKLPNYELKVFYRSKSLLTRITQLAHNFILMKT